MTWRRFLPDGPFVRGIHWSLAVPSRTGPEMWMFSIFFVCLQPREAQAQPAKVSVNWDTSLFILRHNDDVIPLVYDVNTFQNCHPSTCTIFGNEMLKAIFSLLSFFLHLRLQATSITPLIYFRGTHSPWATQLLWLSHHSNCPERWSNNSSTGTAICCNSQWKFQITGLIIRSHNV